MGSISERERILLGYAPYDTIGSVGGKSQVRNSDVDFIDVFGGPPRRSSLYENRRSRGDSIDSYSRPNRGREESMGSHRSRLASGDKPVFGDGGNSGRIQQLGDDFFGDIFQISESSCSSPRGGDRDPLMSSPTSRISSPNLPASPLLEPFSLPTHSSLLETMGKGSDHPSLGSPSERFVYRSEDGGFEAYTHSLSPSASYAGFSPKQSVVGSGDLKNYGYGSYRQSPLSRPIRRGFEGFLEATEPDLQKVECQIGKTSYSIEDYINNRQFHFSIYKWAGKGVMLVMPSDSNEGNELEGLTRLPEVVVQELELQTQDDYLSSLIKPSKSGTIILENKSDIADDYAGTTTKISHAKSSHEGDTNKTSDKYGKHNEKDSVSDFDKIPSTNSTVRKQNPEFWINAHNEPNTQLKSLSQLFNGETEKQRSSDIFRQVKENEIQSKSQKKQQLQRENKFVPGEDNSINFHDIPSISDDKPRGSKIKGKVKEFIKKFNQDAPPKWKGAFEILNRRSKVEDSKQDNADALAHVSFTGSDEMHEGSGNKSIPLFDIRQVMENQIIEKAEEKSTISYSDPIMDNPPSEERVEVLHSQSEPPLEELNDATWYEEIIHEDIEEFLVQQLPIDQIEGLLSGSQQDQIKDLDANIRQWSKGKEGNIRSLLSTLQLVLWPESGWKQVPLVNIIEGPSVKKAYQKALLCLHPDKLQQKGASSNQKYIAEKVFDILQEAWDLFNSVSQF